MIVPVLVLAVAACGSEKGSDIPTAGGGSGGATPAATASLSSDERALKFAQCMRDQGIDMPDPGTDGSSVFGKGAASKDKLDAATEACRQYMPDGGELRQPSAERIDQLRKFAQCMREHGIAKFPDPQADGLMDIQGAGIDPEDAAYQAAEEACAALQPGPGS
ncbi:hypothetical protein [Micromonospora deserti]|uniref:Uncharacterized protein n=1 Tax=Micromonospora deserti TaxID=2070366 RepID=A0A2W2DPE5_9ACTN|nr:hypothetical protein [Micromonospora deserti]PZG02790.1 hypothetical protein C1I99_01220 [Micromonospora deserti]